MPTPAESSLPIDMGFGHVLVHGDMAAALRAAYMAGDTRVILEDLDSPISEPHVHSTADQPVRHRVKRLVDFDVIVGMDLGGLPLGVFEWLARQRRQGFALRVSVILCKQVSVSLPFERS